VSSDGLHWRRVGPAPDPAAQKRNEELRAIEVREVQENYDRANTERAEGRRLVAERDGDPAITEDE